MPRSEHGLPPFRTVRAYSICPAPALPGTRRNAPVSRAPVHGAADVADAVVVTVRIVVTVTVCEAVTVRLPRPQPATVSPTAATTSPAAARRPAIPALRRSEAAPARASPGRAR